MPPSNASKSPGKLSLTTFAVLALAWGCGGGSSSSSTGMTTGTGGNGGHAGNGGAPPGKLSSATPISTDVAYALAFDATLSNDGAIVYFTGVGPNGVGVFSAPTSGGAPQEIAAGAAFGAPFGIALSTDGKKLFVADPGASGTALDGGRILTVDPEQGTVTPVAGTEDALPRGLEVGQANGKDQLYFTGTVKGVAGIYKIPAAGGTITTLAQGMDDPSGIAVTKAGTVYLIDTTGSPTRHASVLTFDGNALTTFYPEIAVGYPAGIALSHDEKTLIISTLEPKKGASSLLLLDILSKEPTRFPGDASLDGLSEPGGLHRARDQQQLAWVSYNPKGGSVLLVK